MSDVYNAFMQSIYSARKRASKSAAAHELTKEQADQLWERCGGSCEVTGIAFSIKQVTGSARRPWAPSIDRIDAQVGYTVDNVRVVCAAVNIAMNEWGEDVLYTIASSIMANGRARRMARSSQHTFELPMDVKLYRGRKSIAYVARARDFGVEQYLGRFFTVDDALAARKAWALKNASAKVLHQIYQFTREADLLEQIRKLSLDGYWKNPDSENRNEINVLGGVADGTRTQAGGELGGTNGT